VKLLRPTAFIAVMVVVGVLAALPFRRSGDVDPLDSHAKPSTAASRILGSSMAVTSNGWSEGESFDPALAWQPVPMTLPTSVAIEVPPMPDSYYDVSYEIQQPASIRERFPAAVGAAEPMAARTGESLPAYPQFGLVKSDRWLNQRPSLPEPSAPLPDKVAIDDVIADRFVYTPIAQPEPTYEPSSRPTTPTGVNAQSASMSRPPRLAPDDPARRKHFIREPD